VRAPRRAIQRNCNREELSAAQNLCKRAYRLSMHGAARFAARALQGCYRVSGAREKTPLQWA